MLMLPAACQIYLCPEPCDMRKGFDGLYAEVRKRCVQSPTSGHLFIFLGKRKNVAKLIFWLDGGLCIFAKRLEQGTFKLPKVVAGQTSVQVGAVDLALLLTGIDFAKVPRPALYQPARSLTT